MQSSRCPEWILQEGTTSPGPYMMSDSEKEARLCAYFVLKQ